MSGDGVFGLCRCVRFAVVRSSAPTVPSRRRKARWPKSDGSDASSSTPTRSRHAASARLVPAVTTEPSRWLFPFCPRTHAIASLRRMLWVISGTAIVLNDCTLMFLKSNPAMRPTEDPANTIWSLTTQSATIPALPVPRRRPPGRPPPCRSWWSPCPVGMDTVHFGRAGHRGSQSRSRPSVPAPTTCPRYPLAPPFTPLADPPLVADDAARLPDVPPSPPTHAMSLCPKRPRPRC